MTHRLSLLSMLLSIFLMGCSVPTTAKPPSPTSASQTPAAESLGQNYQFLLKPLFLMAQSFS